MAERAALERLLRTARAGQGQAFVVRGEAGVGKTTLLQHAQSASGFRVAQVGGVQSEPADRSEALHQRAHRRVPPAQSVHQARHQLPQPDRLRVRLRRKVNGSARAVEPAELGWWVLKGKIQWAYMYTNSVPFLESGPSEAVAGDMHRLHQRHSTSLHTLNTRRRACRAEASASNATAAEAGRSGRLAIHRRVRSEFASPSLIASIASSRSAGVACHSARQGHRTSGSAAAVRNAASSANSAAKSWSTAATKVLPCHRALCATVVHISAVV
jgi:hypothetical protein